MTGLIVSLIRANSKPFESDWWLAQAQCGASLSTFTCIKTLDCFLCMGDIGFSSMMTSSSSRVENVWTFVQGIFFFLTRYIAVVEPEDEGLSDVALLLLFESNINSGFWRRVPTEWCWTRSLTCLLILLKINIVELFNFLGPNPSLLFYFGNSQGIIVCLFHSSRRLGQEIVKVIHKGHWFMGIWEKEWMQSREECASSQLDSWMISSLS